MNYYIATDRYGNYDIAHGLEWRKHKYIRKEGNRYIYPEDLKKLQAQKAARQAQERGKKRTAQYKSGGFDNMSSTLYPDGSRRFQTDYTNVRKEQEFEVNKPAREHQARLNAGAESRAASVRRQAVISRATAAVKKFGTNTLNSTKSYAAKGASFISSLLKRKK